MRRAALPNPSAGTPVGERIAELARAVDGARPRGRGDVRQVLLVSGAIAIGLGLVAILLGWYGAAHSPYLFQEIPYVISGGLLGVALVAAGGLFILSSWVIRVLDEERRQGAYLEELVSELRQARWTAGSANGSGHAAHLDDEPEVGAPAAQPLAGNGIVRP